MLIRIINGTYGHSPMLPDGRKSPYVVPVNRKTGPIDVEPKEADRLVEAGVAEYVADEPVHDMTEAPEVIPESKEETITGHLDGADLESMSFSDLKVLAKDMGIDTGKIKSKAAMIQAISEVEVTASAEELPDLDAQDVID
jgi:hypothetical protein